MRYLLAIDPGTESTGFCVFDLEIMKPINYWTHYYTSKRYYNEIEKSIRRAVRECPDVPKIVVFESFFGRANTREVIGIMKKYLEDRDIEFNEVSPNSVKRVVTGCGGRKSTKSKMIKAINEEYGLDLKYKDRHEADAIGIAKTGCETFKKDIAK